MTKLEREGRHTPERYEPADFHFDGSDEMFGLEAEEQWVQGQRFESLSTKPQPVRRKIEDWWEDHDLDDDLPPIHNHRGRTPKRARKYAAHKPH